MYSVVINLDNGYALENREPIFTIKGNVVSATADSIKCLLDKHRKEINRWLLMGRAQMQACFEKTGELIMTGTYDYDVWSGHGEYQFKMER